LTARLLAMCTPVVMCNRRNLQGYRILSQNFLGMSCSIFPLAGMAGGDICLWWEAKM